MTAPWAARLQRPQRTLKRSAFCCDTQSPDCVYWVSRVRLCDPKGCIAHQEDSPRKNATVPFSRGSSQPADQTRISCIAGRCFTI